MSNLDFRQWFDSTGFEHHCLICKTNVRKKSKHCGQCNRCTEEFDHHCAVLNNCIGLRNYWTFFYLILTAFSMCLLHLLVDLYVIPKALPSTRATLLLGSSILINLVALLLIGHLICRHIYLQRAGLSTYEYILIQEGK